MSEKVVNRPRGRISGWLERTIRLRPERRWSLMSVLALAFLLTVSGAYRTAGLPSFHRSLLWLIVCGLVAGQFLGIAKALGRLGPARRLAEPTR